MSDYWLYQSYNKENLLQIIGITGGILKIFQSINYITGNIILYITHYLITNEMDKTKDLRHLGNASKIDLTIVENNDSNIIIKFPPKSQLISSLSEDFTAEILNEVIYVETYNIIKDLSDLKLYKTVCEIYPEVSNNPDVFIELSTFNTNYLNT